MKAIGFSFDERGYACLNKINYWINDVILFVLKVKIAVNLFHNNMFVNIFFLLLFFFFFKMDIKIKVSHNSLYVYIYIY